MIISKITGKTYVPEEVVFLRNITQFCGYMNTGLIDEYVVDILYDKHKEKNKLTFVVLRNDVTKELYRKWNAHELEY